MRIAIAQIDPVVGAFNANVRKIREAYERACAAKADLLLTPELSVCGYPPHDLVDRPEMVERCELALNELVKLTAAPQARSCALAVGHIAHNPRPTGRASQNCVTVLLQGKRVFTQAKSLLPTYDVFDEARYFEPAHEIKLWEYQGRKIAMAICEDLWAHDPALGRALYDADPVQRYGELGSDLIISVSGSPYIFGKRERREEIHREIARKLKAPLVYVNQCGATDEILFDGASFAVNTNGETLGRLAVFKTSFGVVDVAAAQFDDAAGVAGANDPREDKAPSEIESLHRGLVVGIREYFKRTGFKTAVMGLSGGIDSALIAVLAVEALGRENVLGVGMPSQYSSAHSLSDAESLARNLGIRFEVRPIKFLYSQAHREISDRRGTLAPLAHENLQSRLRGLILMTLSNNDGSLVITTGNKSEFATGYCTLYGDMCGAIAPLGDVLKTRVYELARHINAIYPGVIPESSVTKPPSAELRPDQKDQDTLPPYDLLDALLEDYLEKSVLVDELEKKYGSRQSDPKWVRETLRRLEINEYKRRQAAPVLKISARAFGVGRRIPIAKSWDQ